MNDLILNSLMKLFALMGISTNKAAMELNQGFFESFLRQYLSKQLIDEKLGYFARVVDDLKQVIKQSDDVKKQIVSLCTTLNSELHNEDKLLIIVSLTEFVRHHKINLGLDTDEAQQANLLLDTVVISLNLMVDEYQHINHFIHDEIHKIADKQYLLHVNNGRLPIKSTVKQLIKSDLQGHFYLLLLQSGPMFLLRYIGSEIVLMGNKVLFSDHTYPFNKGSVIKWGGSEALYYNEIAACFFTPASKVPFQFEVNQVNYAFRRSTNGIHGLHFTARSGQMIGIMGSSGSGKSTLLNILNGTITPLSGTIKINGYHLNEFHQVLTPLMGYVPQDDILFEELTVYQNLYYCARICYGNLSEHKINELCNALLAELNLAEYQHLKVGSPLSKFISGGQRKRLNIALELIREPYILFVDEPTSGLSTADAEKMMELLRQQTFRGRLLFINIHQPSSTIFKQFDQLIILDKGGYVVYTGNPIDAITYFKKMMSLVDADEAECARCGNISSETILNILEYPKVDAFGHDLNQRKILPSEWHSRFAEHQPAIENSQVVTPLPEIGFRLPSRWQQFISYTRRNMAVKIADTQYLSISLLIAPVLAIILAFLAKFMQLNNQGNYVYSFIDNENVPAFLFMSVIVSLFIGLTLSAEEIFRDRKIVMRESFIHLSRLSYLNSKIILLFFISACQMLLFVVISNYILEIKNMTFHFWILLFSLSCFAVMFGLNISSAFKSVVTIYIVIPLIIVPQILLSGVIIKFDKLHHSATSNKEVPVVGDLMASRWAFEGLMVYQFMNNEYQKNFYMLDKEISNASFKANYTIPRLENLVQTYQEESPADSSGQLYTRLIADELVAMLDEWGMNKPDVKKKIVKNEANMDEILALLSKVKLNYSHKVSRLMQVKTALYYKVTQNVGSENIRNFKNKNVNDRLSEFVLNTRELNRVKIADNQIIQLYEPIYLEPDSRVGRAHFYAPVKKIWVFSFDTFWFNLAVLWLMSMFLYISLYYNWFFAMVKNLEKLAISLNRLNNRN